MSTEASELVPVPPALVDLQLMPSAQEWAEFSQWRAMQRRSRASLVTVTEAVRSYLDLRLAEGMKKKSDLYRHLRKHLAERLCDTLGEMKLADVRTAHLRDWAKALSNPRNGAPMHTRTVNHHVKDLKVFFKRARQEGWLETSPADALRLQAMEEGDVHVMTVREAFELFRKNRNSRAIGRVAMEAFGGIRYTTAGRLGKDDIKFAQEGIEMAANKHKSRRRNFRQGQPANLWAWLRHAPEACWEMSPRQYAEDKKEMLVIAGLRPMTAKSEADHERFRELRNVWRHSFASYHLAQGKDFAKTGYFMQHSSPKTTRIYEGRATEADAALYFAITPESVLLTWEEFERKHGVAPLPPCHRTP